MENRMWKPHRGPGADDSPHIVSLLISAYPRLREDRWSGRSRGHRGLMGPQPRTKNLALGLAERKSPRTTSFVQSQGLSLTGPTPLSTPTGLSNLLANAEQSHQCFSETMV